MIYEKIFWLARSIFSFYVWFWFIFFTNRIHFDSQFLLIFIHLTSRFILLWFILIRLNFDSRIKIPWRIKIELIKVWRFMISFLLMFRLMNRHQFLRKQILKNSVMKNLRSAISSERYMSEKPEAHILRLRFRRNSTRFTWRVRGTTNHLPPDVGDTSSLMWTTR